MKIWNRYKEEDHRSKVSKALYPGKKNMYPGRSTQLTSFYKFNSDR